MKYLFPNSNKNKKYKIGLPPNKRYRFRPLARHDTWIDLGNAIMIRYIAKNHLIFPTFSNEFPLWEAKVIKMAKFNGTKVPHIKLRRNRFLFWPFVVNNQFIIIGVLLAEGHKPSLKGEA